jgi:hypothetical protein
VRATNDSGVTLVLLICGHVDGHYLNLPVVEEDGRLVAIVDVLKLTYATLEQVRSNLRFSESSYEFILLSDESFDRRGSW